MRNGYFGVWLSIAVVLAVGVGFNILGGIVLVLIYGTDIKGGAPSVIVLVNAFAQVLMMIGLPIFIVKSQEKDFFASFRLEGMSETRLPVHLMGIPIIAVGQILGGAIASLWAIGLSQFPDMYSSLNSFQDKINDMMTGLTTAHNPSELTALLFGVAVIPAFAEELFFRGFIQTNIERSGKVKSRPITALIITSVLFAALHVSPLQFPGLLVIGLLLGWLAYRTCDLRVSALAHAFNNGAIVIMIYLSRENSDVANTLAGSPEFSLGESLGMIAATAPILFGLLYLFQKMTEPIQARKNADRLIEEYERAQTEFSN